MEFSLVELISAVSSFSALLTAIIVFFTLVEMKRQRQSAYRPDLVFKPIRFSFSIDFSDTDILNYKIVSQKGNNDSKNQLYTPTYQFYNIGLGSAKEIYLTLNFDYRKAIKLVNELIENIGVNLIISLENNIVKVYMKKGFSTRTVIDIEGDLKSDIDYVLPTSITNEPAVLSFPHSYVLLLGFYFIFNTYINAKNDIMPTLKGFPALKMAAKFNDIGGKTYKKNYKIDSRYLTCNLPCNNYSVFLKNSNVDFLIEFNAT